MTRRGITALAVAVVLAGCGSAQPTASPPASQSPAETVSPTAVASGGSPAPGASSVPEPSAVVAADTSQDRIAAALAAGQIDHPTSLLYRAHALVASTALPEQYRGAAGSAEDDFALPLEVRSSRDALPAETASQIDAVLARPTAAGSTFVAPPQALSGRGLLAALGTTALGSGGIAQAGDCQPTAAGSSWRFLDAAVPVRVWAPCFDAASGPEIDLTPVVGWVDEFYGPMVDVMGPPILDTGDADAGGSTAVDVYIVDFCVTRAGECQSLGTAKGLANPADPESGGAGARKSSGYILMPLRVLTADPSALHNSLIHEFFHVLQYAHNYEALVVNSKAHWFAEASAKWSETHFRRDNSAAVHSSWFPYFQQKVVSVHRPATPADNYAAYIWPFFMELKAGAATVGAAWRNIEAKTSWPAIDDAIDSALGYSGSFRDFAVKNIDQALPGDALGVRYDQFDSHFPVGFQPNNKLQARTTINNGDAELAVGQVPALSALYYQLEPAADVEVVKFFFGLDPAESVDIDFVYERADGAGWMRRTVATPAFETKFCFNRPEEEFKYALMVISNHDHGDVIGRGAIGVSATDQPCDQGGSGTVTITREKHGTYTSNRNNPVQVDMTDTATITFELEADEFSEGIYNATHSSITWSYSLNAVETADECEIVEIGKGQGSWKGDDGPGVLLGWSAPDGTLFGMMIDEKQYVLNAFPPPQNLPDGDPSGYYEVSSRICGMTVIPPGTWWPYVSFAIVSGALPEEGTGTFSGSRQRTLPPLNSLDLPTVETVTWSFTLGETATP